MTKIVYNDCYGGFCLSAKAIARYKELGGSYECDRHIPRNDSLLVQVVEELGKDANGACASLEIRDLAPGTKYRIDEYDGNENVVTIDEEDWKVA